MGGDGNTVHLVTRRRGRELAGAGQGRGRDAARRSGSPRPCKALPMSDRASPILRLPHGADLPLPAYASDGRGRARSRWPRSRDGRADVIAPLGARSVPTGLVIALPHGYEGTGAAALRTGAARWGDRAQRPGTIDADYRGEVKVPLINLGAEPFDARARHAHRAARRRAGGARAPGPRRRRSTRRRAARGGFGSTGARWSGDVTSQPEVMR